MSARPRRRSHEPVVWLLFAAGGMAAAMLLPALIVVIGLAGPIGLLSDGSLDYERVSGLVGHPLGRLMVFAVLSLLFWHAMHRIFHGLHDIGIETRGKPYRVITYGFAALATLVTAGLVLML